MQDFGSGDTSSNLVGGILVIYGIFQFEKPVVTKKLFRDTTLLPSYFMEPIKEL